MPPPITMRAHAQGTLLDVWVVPGAKQSEIVGAHDGALRVRIAAAAEAGKANRAVARLLSREIGASDAYLERGARGRRKQFVIVGMDPAAVADALSNVA